MEVTSSNRLFTENINLVKTEVKSPPLFTKIFLSLGEALCIDRINRLVRPWKKEKKPFTQSELKALLKTLQAKREARLEKLEKLSKKRGLSVRELGRKMPEKPFSLKKHLQKKGFSLKLSHLKFTLNNLTVEGLKATPRSTELLHSLDLSGLEFDNCTFKHAGFQKMQLKGSLFRNCDFFDSYWIGANLKGVRFERCRLEEALFTYTKLSNVSFRGCNLSYASFNRANLDKVTFASSKKLQGISFLGAEVREGRFVDCKMENALLFELPFSLEKCTPHRITMPLIGLMWDTATPGYTGSKVWRRMKERKCLPIKLDFTLPIINKTRLTKEVKEHAASFEKMGLFEGVPKLFTQAAKGASQGEMHQVAEIARSYIRHLDGIVLPGGDHVASILYNEPKANNPLTKKNVRRTLLEFLLTEEAINLGVPLLGICRGSQLVNAYKGGKINPQVVDHHAKMHTHAFVENKKGIFRGLTEEDSLTAFCYHHQGVFQPGEGIEAVLKNEGNGIVEASESKHGAPILLIQSHPEFKDDYRRKRGHRKMKRIDEELSKANRKLWNAFIDACSTKKKRVSLQEELKKRFLKS